MSEIGDDDSVFDLLPEFRLTPEERAVIEAARALVDDWPFDPEDWEVLRRLYVAIEALDKAEAGT